MSNSYDKDGYNSPPAQRPYVVPTSPISKTKIPCDEEHICPCCEGRGYVGIVNEKDVPQVKKNVHSKLFPYMDGV